MTSAYCADILARYFDNDYEYLYYKFLDKWHVRPRDFKEIFSFIDFVTVESKVQTFQAMMAKMQRGE